LFEVLWEAMTRYCPLCINVVDEQVTITASGLEERVFVCMDSSHGAEGYPLPAMPTRDTPRSDGRRARQARSEPPVSDIEEKLLACIPQGPDFTPYGAVEDRFFELWPDDADTLMMKYGHKWRGDGQVRGAKSTSQYLVGRLSSIKRQGLAEHIDGPAVDPWTHLPKYSHWRLPQD
jgi:hypothetical protein